MKTLRYADREIQGDKFVKTQDSIIAYINDVENVRIHPLSSSFTYTVYNEDGTVGTFDTDIGINSSTTDLLKLVYIMMKEINTLREDITSLQTEVTNLKQG